MTAENTPRLESVLTCPSCGHARSERMPTDACLFFYECGHCKQVLRPQRGDCCVFCSYGSVRCPPMQMQFAAEGESSAGCRRCGDNA